MNEKITLQDLAELLAERHNLDDERALSFIKEFFSLIEAALATDKYVKVKGFGAFKLIEVDSRESIDINTGKRIEIPSYTKVSFTPDTAMKGLINRPFSHFEPVILNEGTSMEDMQAGLRPETDENDDDNSPQDDTESEPVLDAAEGRNLSDLLSSSVIESKAAPVSQAGLPETNHELTELEDKIEVPITSSLESVEVGKTSSLALTESKEADTEENDIQTQQSIAAVPESDLHSPKKDAGISDEEEIKRIDEPESSQKHPFCYPWCMIASVLLTGVLLGGFASWMLMSGRRYIPESICEILIAQEDNLPKPSVQIQTKSFQDSLVSNEQLKKDTVPVNVSLKSDEPEQKIHQQVQKSEPKVVVHNQPVNEKIVLPVREQQSSLPKKVETLADTIEYTITGTKTSHTIQPGESLVKLAQKFYGNKKLWPYIARHNRDNLKNVNNVPVGAVIKIPELKPRK